MPEDTNDEVFTIEQCAQFLKVSPWTIYDLVSDERRPDRIFAKKVGRSWRILRSEVERFLTEEPRGTYKLRIDKYNKK